MTARPASPQINLLKAKRREVVEQRKVAAKVQGVTLVALVTYAALLFGLLSWRALQTRKLDQLEADISQKTKIIQSMAEVEAKHSLVKQKLTVAKKFYQQQVQARQKFLQVYARLPEGTELQEVVFGETETRVQLVGSASDVYTANTMLDEAEALLEAAGFEQVDLESMRREEDATYQFDAAFVYKS